ncbi:reverse transcriptase [Phytophthora megakarya]|uniref:Reverse transcriptase n=1 Tax=Phytophthora megakarya TaxID=4795 RepID=A0A225VH14_9STRA|nr:reverse transcriptase [Phytophthora megakarya]
MKRQFGFKEGDYPTSSMAWLTEFAQRILCIFTLNNTARSDCQLDAAVDRMGWTQISLGHSGVVLAAIKLVNISDRIVTIDWRTEVAQVLENGFFSRAGRYVRVGTRRYREWQNLIYENTISAKAQARESQRLDDLQEMEPPAVQTPNYPWPTKMMVRPSPGCEEARVINLQIVPSEVYDEISEVGERLSMKTPVVSTTIPEVSEISEVEDETTDVPSGEVEGVLDDQDSDGDEFFDSISVEDDFPEVNLEDIPKVELEDDVFSDLPVSVMACTPVQQLELEYYRVMRISAEELDLEHAGYIHERSETLSQLWEQLALLPDIEELYPKCDIDSTDVGESGTSTPEDERRLRAILKYHRAIFLGDGSADPSPARGITCDLDVGEANPKRLETRLIEHSESPWASPIVIVLKQNGVDIRMCVDYRIVNGFITLSNYPLPLIGDLLVGFEDVMWFMSLDMASGFWAIKMSERAKLISAFVCPFGHFQWTCMPFGLKNAPLIYQSVINNCLWGFVRLPPEEEAEVDQDVLDFLGLDPTDNQKSERSCLNDEVKGLTDLMTVSKGISLCHHTSVQC